VTSKRSDIRLSNESGATIVLVAVALFALIMVVALVVDVANWYVHKRHLQTQADAAALAGGAAFKLPGCNDTEIQTAVEQYSGKQTTLAASPYNVQIGKTPDANIQVLLNSEKYWPDGGANFTDGGTPCASSVVDVKMTESNLPWFLGGSFVPAINAHARVSFRTVSQLKGQLPIGVVDVNPQSGAVIFYDEANPATTYARYLRKINTGGGLNEWANTDPSGPATPISVPMPASGRLGAVVAFSSDGPPLSAPMSIAGTVTEICGRPRVDCYSDPASSGLLFAHGYSTAAAGKTPVVRGATLSTSNCPDSYAYFTYNDASCTATLTVEFASTVTDLTNVKLTATPGGNCTGGGGDATNSFTRTFNINIPAHAGPCPITVTWIVKNETGLRPGSPSPPCQNRFNGSIDTGCQGSFGIVQRAFGGDDDLSGPIRTAHLLNMGGSFGSPSCPGPLGFGPACNSWAIEDDPPHSLAVDVQLAGAISTSVDDPPVLLRIVGGSRNGTIDCNRTGNLREQLANGCDLPYRINTDPALACPWATKTELLASQTPYPCVAVQTGGSVGQFTQGIQDRILNGASTCPASGPGRNYWPTYPDFPSTDNSYGFNDPRIVYVFMVPFGSFRGAGNTILPIVSFGIFYVRGWGGNGGNNDPCTGPGNVPNVPVGDLAGNFITHVADSADAYGTEACVVGSLNPCVAVLTK
jgi:hypothetical protein